jgi:hypothetical protein
MDQPFYLHLYGQVICIIILSEIPASELRLDAINNFQRPVTHGKEDKIIYVPNKHTKE